MAGLILYCLRQGCGAGYSGGETIPMVCPSCRQPTRWSTMPPRAATVDGWAPNVEDRRFLRSLLIGAD